MLGIMNHWLLQFFPPISARTPTLDLHQLFFQYPLPRTMAHLISHVLEMVISLYARNLELHNG